MLMTVVLLMLVNLNTMEIEYEQFKSIQECHKTEMKLKKLVQAGRIPMLVLECAEYDIELEVV